MIRAWEKQKAAENIVIVTLDHFAGFENSDKVVFADKILAINRQFEHLLPDCVVSTIDASKELKVKSWDQFATRWTLAVLKLAWLGTTTLLHLFLYALIVEISQMHRIRKLLLIGLNILFLKPLCRISNSSSWISHDLLITTFWYGLLVKSSSCLKSVRSLFLFLD